MNDILNTMETNLKAALDAWDTTPVFNLRDNEIKEDPRQYQKHELPALVFEFYGLDDSPDLERDDILNVAHFMMFVLVENADRKTARQRVKQYISLVRDFFKSTNWSYADDTILEQSELATGEMEKMAFRTAGSIPGRVEIKLD